LPGPSSARRSVPMCWAGSRPCSRPSNATRPCWSTSVRFPRPAPTAPLQPAPQQRDARPPASTRTSRARSWNSTRWACARAIPRPT
jgi:hypothetical protein